MLHHGIRWTLAPAAQIDLSDVIPQIENGQAHVVKNGAHRMVCRLVQGIYWKHCKLATLRAWAREILRPPKARLEFDKALSLHQRGVATFEPLAWGVRPGWMPGESFLLTRALEGATSLQQRLEQPFTTHQRRQLTERLGGYLAHLHEVGVTHPDLHPGNILLRETDGNLTFYLLDLHAIHLGSALDREASFANLVMLNRWFLLRVTRTDRLRFWRAYCTYRPQFYLADGKRLEVSTDASNYRFWQSRKWRFTANNRYYRKLATSAASGYAVRDCPAEWIAEFLSNPDAPFKRDDVTWLKNSRSASVIRLSLPTADGPREMIYKRFRLRSKRDSWLNLVRSSAALRSWCLGQTLRDRHLPTPRPWLVLHRRRQLRPAEGYLLTDYIAGARDLHAYLSERPGLTNQRLLIDQLARLIRVMHDRHLTHRDLKPSNLLIEADGAIQFIDLVGVRDRATVTERMRIRDVMRLNAGLLARPEVTRTDRLRFLRAYLCWALSGSREWKRWWRAIARLTAAKVTRNALRGRPLA